MLRRFFERRHQHHALHKFRRSALGAALRRHTQKFFNETILRDLSPQSKQITVEQLSYRLIAIDNSPNPFLTFRKELCNAAISYANLQVLCLSPEEKSANFRDVRYVSGDLFRYIRQCAGFNREIAKIILEHPQSNDDELIAFTKISCAVLLYDLEGLNLVRLATKIDPPGQSADKDWFRPLITSMLILSEDTARQKLGLPRLCFNSVAALRHGSFMTDVASGKADPLAEWERFFGKKHVNER